jgi:hypothetical protein
VLLQLVITCVLVALVVDVAARPAGAGRAVECKDRINDCAPRRERVSQNGDCVTFRCESGTTREHTIKTNNPEDIKTLMKLIAQQRQ